MFGGILLGTWLLLIPIRFVSVLAYEAYLIDPNSAQTGFMRFVQITLITLTLAQIFAAWICGGKLRYFFWQLFAPFSFAVWVIRKLIRFSAFRSTLNFCLGWLSPNLVTDICNAKPPTDWFVPAILWKKVRERRLYIDARDGLWNFVGSLNLWYYFSFGFKGFVGTLMWMILPTLLLIGATGGDRAINGLAAFLGIMIAIPVFAILPFMQAHYATDGKFIRFFEPWKVLGIFRRAPIAHVLALLIVLALALPLFLLKIEEIPRELMWTLSIVFILFTWPSRIVVGLAYRRGTKRPKGWWWVRLPIMSLAMPVHSHLSLSFSLRGTPAGMVPGACWKTMCSCCRRRSGCHCFNRTKCCYELCRPFGPEVFGISPIRWLSPPAVDLSALWA